MALVHRPVAAPHVSLQNALDEFRAALPPAEQAQLDASKPPGISEVVALTSQLDQNSSKKLGRCVAPKLLTFLNAFKRFSDVIETFVNANPTTAALAWGTVKVFLMFASDFAEYFDKLTDVLRDIGETCPSFEEYGTLFASSVKPQDSLTSYYAVVVKIFSKAVLAFQRSGFGQLFKTVLRPFHREFGDLLGQLTREESTVQDYIALAKTRLQVEEAKYQDLERSRAQIFRTLVGKFNTKTAQQLAEMNKWLIEARSRQTQLDRETAKDNLSTIDPRVFWRRTKRASLARTGNWFLEHPILLSWIRDQSSKILCYSAKLGSGKTSIFTKVIDYLATSHTDSVTLSYFFCRPKLAGTLEPRAIIGCLVRQLLDMSIDSAQGAELDRLIKGSRSLDGGDLVEIAARYLVPGSTYYIMLDGIDNLDMATAALILGQLQQISTDCPLTCSNDMEEDIEFFVKFTLDEKLEREALYFREPESILVIRDEIIKRAQGMYLWAKLLIEHLCLIQTDDDIALINALEECPSELATIYDRILALIIGDATYIIRVARVLKWASGSVRPLTLYEMREAVAIEQGQTSLSMLSLAPDMIPIILSCGGLVSIDPDDSTISLVHDSLARHLCAPALHSTDISLRTLACANGESALQEELFVICATYLNFPQHTRQVVRAQGAQNIPLQPYDIAQTALTGTRAATILKARKLLSLPKDLKSAETQETLDSIRLRLQSSTMRAGDDSKVPFLFYAQESWTRHAASMEKGEVYSWARAMAETDRTANLRPPHHMTTWKLLEDLVDSPYAHIVKPWEHKQYADLPERIVLPIFHVQDKIELSFFGQDFYERKEVIKVFWACQDSNPALLRILWSLPSRQATQSGRSTYGFSNRTRMLCNLLGSVDRLIRLSRLSYRKSIATVFHDLLDERYFRDVDKEDRGFASTNRYITSLWDLAPPTLSLGLMHSPAFMTVETVHLMRPHSLELNNFRRWRTPFRLSVVARNHDISPIEEWKNAKEQACSPLCVALLLRNLSAYSALLREQAEKSGPGMRFKAMSGAFHVAVMWNNQQLLEELWAVLNDEDRKLPPELIRLALQSGHAPVSVAGWLYPRTENKYGVCTDFSIDGKGSTLLMYAAEAEDSTLIEMVLNDLTFPSFEFSAHFARVNRYISDLRAERWHCESSVSALDDMLWRLAHEKEKEKNFLYFLRIQAPLDSQSRKQLTHRNIFR